ncbi:MAG TPA: hypothetical protein VEV19_13590 [Ktedonobacteraceae bacterium]|nr:hypothetical protein [Ktedonobacteraceae bacterium]
MPRSRKRRRGATAAQKSGRSSTTQKTVENTSATNRPVRPTVANRPFLSPRVVGPQSLLWPTMVALGCWGMAFSFYVFYNDPNHILYGSMAALLALLWSFSVAVRVRKLMLIRRNQYGRNS